jgi:hypothetical protein
MAFLLRPLTSRFSSCSVDAYSTFRSTTASRPFVPVLSSGAIIAELTLPAGHYIVNASVSFTTYWPGATAGVVRSALAIGNPLTAEEVFDSFKPQNLINQGLAAAGAITAPSGKVWLICYKDAGGGDLYAYTYSLNAIKVNTLSYQ